jgi:lipoprotein NlpD
VARLCLLLGVALAAGCISTSSVHIPSSRGTRTAEPARAAAGVHVVRRGETLYQIAFQYRIDQRDLARWNRIRNPDRISVGQRLRLTPPRGAATAPAPAQPAAQRAPRASPRPEGPPPRAAAPQAAPPRVVAQPPPLWLWPTDGEVVTRFGSSAGIGTGIGIRGREGQPVRAAAGGRVVYAGNGLIGYGQLVIIKHNDTYLSAYGYNSRLLVTQGQDVARGTTIAYMGQGPERQPRLHFEIRRDGAPVDPLLLLQAPR